MSFTLKWRAAIAEAESHEAHKIARTKELRLMYARQGKDQYATDQLVDRDQIVQEAQLLHERAIAKAAAYGPGAIIEALARR